MIWNGIAGYRLRNLVASLTVFSAVLFMVLGFSRPVFAKEIVVSSAASLADAFRILGKLYETAHPQDKVVFNFASSGTLLRQIAQGAPVDVFASADEDTMDQAQKQGLIFSESRQDFICNHLVLVTSLHHGLLVRQLSDLDQPMIRTIAIGQVTSVPAGHYAQQALQQAGLWQSLQGRLVPAENVRQVLDYVARDEADVGFVYASDAWLFRNRVRTLFSVTLPHSVQYPIALTRDSQNSETGKEFIAWIQSSKGQEILRQYGFSSCHS